MRKKISEKNRFPVFNIDNEYKKMQDLFCDKRAFGKNDVINGRLQPRYSYSDCLAELFLGWKLRGTFTNLHEMLYMLGISEKDFKEQVTDEKLLDYIQFVFNAIAFVDKEAKKNGYYRNGDTIFNAIIDNGKQILEKLGAHLSIDNQEFFVIYKNDVATITSIIHKDIEPSIVEYLKIDNYGSLTRKEEVLCTLAKKLEGFEKDLNATEFKALCSDTTFLFDKTGIRHNRNAKDRIESIFDEMTPKERECWYDNAFQLFLACMAVVPYLEIKKKIKAIKKDDNIKI